MAPARGEGPEDIVVSVRIEQQHISRDDDGEMARKTWTSPYEDVVVPKDNCSVVGAVNLNGLVLFAFILVSLSWALDEIWDAFHAQDAHENFLGGILAASGGHASLAFLARCALAVCVFFVVAIWSTSAYIKFKYLTPHGKDRPCPNW
ncbi:Hypothetical Protein FCC1311_035792 [Hondaea fermentalgiana]|uniref:Uncharacterized protein n=1 Tax=Hondaea fermentalgiana TaxID=2315210 RepID=A0A2R5G8I1_9STRA|nr:Hypothetical Protein FCC1311_035792 [Hondaea fermentalgiana]|eukprot:GBG27357.1 Hypothetical Protein FCC1311_035792 [Hondaea fermentalgiana]